MTTQLEKLVHIFDLRDFQNLVNNKALNILKNVLCDVY